MGKVLKIIGYTFLAILIIVILLGLTGFFIFKDITDMKEKLPTSNNMILLASDDKIIIGIQMEGLKLDLAKKEGKENEGMPEMPFNFFTDFQLDELSKHYKKRNYKEMLGNNYKMIIIKSKILDPLPETIPVEFGDEKEKGKPDKEEGFEIKTIQKKFAFELLESDNPIELFVDYYISEAEKEGKELPKDMSKEQLKEQLYSKLEEQMGTPEKFKVMVFIVMAKNLIEQQGKENAPFFVIENFKKGNIIIYPKTIAIKVAKAIPMPVYNKIFEKIKSKMQEKEMKEYGKEEFDEKD